MKHFVYTLLAALCMGLFASCSGNTDEGDAPLKDGKVHIYADKTTLVANGADKVTFQVIYDGVDVSKESSLSLLVTYPDGEEKDMGNTCQFSTTTAGTYKVRADYYKGGHNYSEETLTITATSAGESKYKHMLLGMEFTSEGCSACPQFANELERVKEDHAGELALAAFHLDFLGVSDFLSIAESQNYLQYVFSARAQLPQFYFNVRKSNLATNRGAVEAELQKELANYPNTCGVAIESTYEESTRKLDVKVKITSEVENEYRYLILLVEDNIPQRQQSSAGAGYLHQNTVRAMLTKTTGERFPAEYRPVPANKEVSASASTTLGKDWNPENMRIIVSMLTTLDGGKTYTSNNTAQCKLGDSVDYAMNE